MKARVTYDKAEVCDMVLDDHKAVFAPPNGMRWIATMDYTDSVTCELVSEEETQTPEAQP